MTAITSTVFWNVQFLHLGRIVTIDQLDFCMPDVTTPTANKIPMSGQSPPPYQSIGVGMLKDSSLMGIFPSNPPNTKTVTVNMIYSLDYDPKGKQIVDSTSLSSQEAMYNVIQTLSDDHTNDLHLVASNPLFLFWIISPRIFLSMSPLWRSWVWMSLYGSIITRDPRSSPTPVR